MLNQIMRAVALIGVALTDDSKSTKKKDAKTKNAMERDMRPTKIVPEASKTIPAHITTKCST